MANKIKVNSKKVYTDIYVDRRVNKPMYNIFLLLESNPKKKFTQTEVSKLLGYANSSSSRYLKKLLSFGYISLENNKYYRYFSGNGRETMV